MEGKEVPFDKSYSDAEAEATEGGGLTTIRGKVAMDLDKGMKGYAQGLVRKIIAALHHEEYHPEKDS